MYIHIYIYIYTCTYTHMYYYEAPHVVREEIPRAARRIELDRALGGLRGLF